MLLDDSTGTTGWPRTWSGYRAETAPSRSRPAWVSTTACNERLATALVDCSRWAACVFALLTLCAVLCCTCAEGNNCSNSEFLPLPALRARFEALAKTATGRLAVFGGKPFAALPEFAPLLRDFLRGK